VAVRCRFVCVATADGLCVHGSALLLQVVQPLERPEDLVEKSSCTAQECSKWNAPGPVVRAKRQCANTGEKRKKRTRTEEGSEGRLSWSPIPQKAMKRLKNRVKQGKHAPALERFFDVCTKALGRPCGFATIYDPRLQIHKDTKMQMWTGESGDD